MCIRDRYETTDRKFAKAYFHWFFLIQPSWLPERMIMSDPKKWMKSCLHKWSGEHKFGKAEEAYLKSFKQKKRIHASCEDYRASDTIDLEHDKKDKNKKLNIPIQVLWGMHWGTFVLSLEPIMEPPIRFKDNAEKFGFKKEDAITFKIGEINSLKSIIKD